MLRKMGSLNHPLQTLGSISNHDPPFYSFNITKSWLENFAFCALCLTFLHKLDASDISESFPETNLSSTTELLCFCSFFLKPTVGSLVFSEQSFVFCVALHKIVAFLPVGILIIVCNSDKIVCVAHILHNKCFLLSGVAVVECFFVCVWKW